MSAIEITVFTKDGGPLTKRISLTADGKVHSDGSACALARGRACRKQLDGVGELADLIEGLGSNQAITLGQLRADLDDDVNIVTKNQLNGHAHDVAARTGDDITYRPGQSTFALIDTDSKGMPEKIAVKIEQAGGVWRLLLSVLPALEGAARVERRSTSSGLSRSDTGEQLPGSKNLHNFVVVKDGADIERFLKTLHDRLWLAGLGWMIISESGRLLERSIIDRIVGTPERLVFEGAPILEPPLEQDKESRKPIAINGDALDTHAACPPLTAAERSKVEEEKAKAGRSLEGEAARAQAAWVERKVASGVPRYVAEMQCRGILLPDVELQFDDPELGATTVADVLRDPDRFVNQTLADPVEGDAYKGGPPMLRRRHNGSLFIHSFAHGCSIYELKHKRPLINVAGGELAKLADLSERILLDADVPFYERSNKLVRIIIKTVDASHDRKTSVAQLLNVDQTYMRDMLARVADWNRWDKRGKKWLPADPPHEIAATILARAGEWRFPTVAGVISTPTMRPDGTILSQPGYDPATRLLLIDPPTMPGIPEAPTRDDALAALALLERLLTEFPLVDDVAKAVALSTLITPTVRGAFPVAPMHAADAPVPASGKSYLLDTAAAIAIGQVMPVIAAGRTEEETEKRLGSALLTGQSLITIDNVNGELGGDALCQIIERQRPQIRILGRSELIDVETRGVTLFANGNNIVIVADLCRRVVRARLDPHMENPELRSFSSEPVVEVLANRGKYIAAALTVCRAYVVAGRPNKQKRLASFEGWSDLVRSALMWLGKADPVASMEASRVEDPERGTLRELLMEWSKVVGTGYANRVTLKEVIELANEKLSAGAYGGAPTMAKPELSAAVFATAGTGKQLNIHNFGQWMRGHKDRVVDDLHFEHKPNAKGSSEWWVVRAEGAVIHGTRTSM